MARGSRCSQKIPTPAMRSSVAAKGDSQLKRPRSHSAAIVELESSSVSRASSGSTASSFWPASRGTQFRIEASSAGLWKTAARSAWHFSLLPLSRRSRGHHCPPGSKAGTHNEQARPNNSTIAAGSKVERNEGHRPLIGFPRISDRIGFAQLWPGLCTPENSALDSTSGHSGGDARSPAGGRGRPGSGPAATPTWWAAGLRMVGWLPATCPLQPDPPLPWPGGAALHAQMFGRRCWIAWPLLMARPASGLVCWWLQLTPLVFWGEKKKNNWGVIGAHGPAAAQAPMRPA